VKRIDLSPRSDWQEKAEACGFMYHTIDGTYWDESVAYEFSMSQINELERVTNELHQMCIKAAEWIIKKDLFAKMGIAHAKERILKSWNADDYHVFGRFDLRYDGKTAPKLYEYNADTPTALFESSVFQWEWLRDVFPRRDQFNSIHEKLIERWKDCPARDVYFTCVRDHKEDLGNTLYMLDVAKQAGIEARHIFVDDIGWNGTEFTDLDENPIPALYKLYPWEWLIAEEFGEHLS